MADYLRDVTALNLDFNYNSVRKSIQVYAKRTTNKGREAIETLREIGSKERSKANKRGDRYHALLLPDGKP